MALYDSYYKFSTKTVTDKLSFQFFVRKVELISAAPCPCKVLEIGCGDGELTKLFGYQSNVLDVLGIDELSYRLLIAYCFNGDERTRFESVNYDDEATWPKAEDQFEFVFSFFTLDRVINKRSILKNAYMRLTKGGHFLARVAGHKTKRLVEIENILNKSSKTTKRLCLSENQKCFFKYTKSTEAQNACYQMLATAEFQEIRCESKTETLVMNEADIKKYLEQLFFHAYEFVSPNEENVLRQKCFDTFIKSVKTHVHDTIRYFNIEFNVVDIVGKKR